MACCGFLYPSQTTDPFPPEESELLLSDSTLPFAFCMPDFDLLDENASGDDSIRIVTTEESSGEPEWKNDLPDLLPVMPLRGVVVFPGTVAPFTVERKASQLLLEELLPHGRLLSLVTQRDADLDAPGPNDVYDVGVLANVLRMLRQDEDTVIQSEVRNEGSNFLRRCICEFDTRSIPGRAPVR